MPVKKNTKYSFVLKDIIPEEIDNKYNLHIISNINNKIEIPKKSTKISEINKDKDSLEIYSFLDESKKQRKCLITMVDIKNKEKNIQGYRDYRCYWCHHTFDTLPLGCPLRFIPEYITKITVSEITKDKITLKEPLTKGQGYYETDGVFCSFNCCMAFIKNNSTNSKYKDSIFLLKKLYSDTFGKSIEKINPAPSWKMLKEYGGNLTIEEFRNSFNKIEYEELNLLIREIPKCKEVGYLHEEKLKL